MKVSLLIAAFAAQGMAFAAGATGDRIWVERPDGGKSCEASKAEKLTKAEAALKKAGVKVHASKKGHDGDMHIQVCGADAGTLNTFEIDAKDLAKAKKAGFKLKPAKQPE